MDLYWKHYLGALAFTATAINAKKSDIESGINYLVDEITDASLNQSITSSIIEVRC